VADENVGKPVRCPACKHPFIVGVALAPPPATPSSLLLEAAGMTSPGRVRPQNEDSFLHREFAWVRGGVDCQRHLLAVADGMGGYEAGDRASALVLSTIDRTLTPALVSNTLTHSKELVVKALQEANREVQSWIQASGAKKAGATAVVLLVNGKEVNVGHVGDCRLYRLRKGNIEQITKDQTLVARMVELGQITPQEALVHPRKNEVSNAVGMRSVLDVSQHSFVLESGDWLIAASDGLHAHVEEATLVNTLSTPGLTPRRAVHELVELANNGGGSDNITALCVRCFARAP
jgi:protein phosphatase